MKLLIADDDTNLRKVLVAELREEKHTVVEADCGVKACELIENNDFDVMLLDLKLPDLNGVKVLKRVKRQEIPTEIIILTGYGSVSTAVETLKWGAYDYLTKPFRIEELVAVIEKAGEKKNILQENLILKAQIEKRSKGNNLITQSPLMLTVLENARNFARSDFPVIILGESGVGKELLAEVVHKASYRANGPFVPINCGAIPDNMMESELFGHEKGAFTSAHIRKLGLLEIANQGTLFLDEIGDLPSNLQKKLLRVVESGSFFRVGGTRQVKVDVRFISATNKDLQQEMESGGFRHDFYYRLSALTINIPPLRARKKDIPLYVENIVKSNSSFRKYKFSKEAMEILMRYPWPGNVRELQNVIHRTLLLSNHNDVITPDDLPADLLRVQNFSNRRLQDVERNHILNVLREVNGKKGEAAKILGIDPKTLYRKLTHFKNDFGEQLGVS